MHAKHSVQHFNFIYRYNDEDLSLNNSKAMELNDLIYTSELKFEATQSSSYLEFYHFIDKLIMEKSR